MFGSFIFGMVLFALLGISVFIFFFVFWILMIIDCASRNFRKDSDKIVWILVIIFLNLLGASIYYFAVKINEKKKLKKRK